MAPKRRTKAGSEQSSSEAKKAKPANDADLARWEWKNDDGQWKSYNAKQSKDILSLFEAGTCKGTLSVGRSAKYEIDFSEMAQSNPTTGWKRDIRCFPNDGVPSDDWEWEDDGKVWRRYPSHIGRLLEAATICSLDHVDFTIGGKQYRFHVKNLQQENTESGVERNVRRHDPEEHKGWEWLDEGGKWNVYSSLICRKLEEAYTADSDADIRIAAGGRSYTVHFTTMEQENDSTGVKRKIRRKNSKPSQVTKSKPAVAAAVPPVPQPAPAAAVSATKPAATKPAATVKKVEFHGKAPVDAELKLSGKFHVYFDDADVWDATLNQTNVMNNNNKFYILQLLEDEKARHNYKVWFRWGRVGYKGQNSLTDCGSNLEQAKSLFKSKFTDKTKNKWEDRTKFVKVPGKYDLVQIDYEAKEEDEVDLPTGSLSAAVADIPESKLDQRVQELIELICDIQAMEDIVREMEYDVQKAPLGKLTVSQIKAGFVALKKIEGFIVNQDFGSGLRESCDEFYTRIPHNFGMSRPPLIKTRAQVKAKVALLETLGDIEIAMKMIQKGGDASENPVDEHYASLDCDLTPLDKTSDEYKMITESVKSTHGKTHRDYRLQVLDIFEAKKAKEWAQYKDVGSKALLWHGSRISNWIGILTKGLRIAPPEAPCTGYMFGKGVYFADVCSKSANYCFASRTQTMGCLLLCEVALGTSNDLLAADHSADKLPRGKHSVKGQGQVAPSKTETLSDGSLLFMGPNKDTGVKNPDGYSLNYNEFIVYDTRQIRMRYLVKVKFDFKR